MGNYILNETKVIDDQNPPWMNTETENLIQKVYYVMNNLFMV